MDIKFNSEQDLYDRLIPALNAKCNELYRDGLKHVKKEDLWNYLKEVKWLSSRSLTLHDMVNNIMNIDETEIDNYVKFKSEKFPRKPIFKRDEENL